MKKTFLALLFFLFSVAANAAGREVAIVSSSSPAAVWIYFSGPSPAADWIHFSGPSPAATYVFISGSCANSVIELLTSTSAYAEWVYISGPSPAAAWLHLSGPSPAADWYHITENEGMAKIKLCIPNKEMRTGQNIAILLHLLKKGK